MSLEYELNSDSTEKGFGIFTIYHNETEVEIYIKDKDDNVKDGFKAVFKDGRLRSFEDSFYKKSTDSIPVTVLGLFGFQDRINFYFKDFGNFEEALRKAKIAPTVYGIMGIYKLKEYYKKLTDLINNKNFTVQNAMIEAAESYSGESLEK